MKQKGKRRMYLPPDKRLRDYTREEMYDYISYLKENERQLREENSKLRVVIAKLEKTNFQQSSTIELMTIGYDRVKESLRK
jgi:hypothetical protein